MRKMNIRNYSSLQFSLQDSSPYKILLYTKGYASTEQLLLKQESRYKMSQKRLSVYGVE